VHVELRRVIILLGVG